jgi:hypothetical protein
MIIFKVHEHVFSMSSSHFRRLVRYGKAKTEENQPVTVNAFELYPIDLVKKFFDLMYQANATQLSVKYLIQLVDLIIDCGYCDENVHPWNFK